MRILVIGSFARSLINFRGPLLRNMNERGYEVIACAPDADSNIKRELYETGVSYCHVPLSRTGLSPLQDLKTLKTLRSLFKREKPDKVLAYTVKPVIYSHLAAKGLRGISVYGMITGLGYGFGEGAFKQQIVGKVVRNLYSLALKQSAGVFFQNPDDRDLFKSLGLVPGYVPTMLINGSGVDLDWFKPQPLPDKPVFLLVARLLAEKGIREYYQAACKIKNKYPQSKFMLAGALDANPASIGQKELQRWQAEGVIEYLGRLSDIRSAFADAGIYVLPSYYREGTPRTVLEAMAMGRPVITTDAPGCRETVVNGQNGFLIPIKDPESLEEAMERFIQEPELVEKMGKQSLRIAREKYDVRKVNQQIMDGLEL